MDRKQLINLSMTGRLYGVDNTTYNRWAVLKGASEELDYWLLFSIFVFLLHKSLLARIVANESPSWLKADDNKDISSSV